MIERRFDFTLAPGLKVYLYGRVGTEDSGKPISIRRALHKFSKCDLSGEYRFEDVDAILASFGVSFTPYTTSSVLTEFINADKYYLYLNSGMKVISTDIPQARRMADLIHIARSEVKSLNWWLGFNRNRRTESTSSFTTLVGKGVQTSKIIQSRERTIASDTM